MKAKTAKKKFGDIELLQLVYFYFSLYVSLSLENAIKKGSTLISIFKCNERANYLKGAENRSSEGGLAVEL